MTKQRTLLIGASGMLSAMATTLAARGDDLVLFARDEARLARLANQAEELPGTLQWSSLDYRDDELLRATTQEWIESLGAFDRVVAWVHASAPAAPTSIARLCAVANASVEFLHVLGSSSADPSRPSTNTREVIEAMGIDYREAILGFIVEGKGRSRWLTHAEISQGVLDALDSPAPRTIIGQVEPWSQRP